MAFLFRFALLYRAMRLLPRETVVAVKRPHEGGVVRNNPMTVYYR